MLINIKGTVRITCKHSGFRYYSFIIHVKVIKETLKCKFFYLCDDMFDDKMQNELMKSVLRL